MHPQEFKGPINDKAGIAAALRQRALPYNRAIAHAMMAINDAAKSRAAFPVVRYTVSLVFRVLAEDAVRAKPAGLTVDSIAKSTGLFDRQVSQALNDLPGVLALYSPGTVALVRDKEDTPNRRTGRPSYVYRLYPLLKTER